MAVNIGMTVLLDAEASPALSRIERDCAVAVVGPDGSAIFTITEDGNVEGDPEAVERAALAELAVNDRARALLALARLAKKVSRPI